ncbi:MAG: phthiocerol/phenolphthiocerol synthesis type-I polyketide synthase, partial [Actinomycetota bacterium]|nr:phthiocerol/phenolphthiocerol synthesis type-I polyketide synthase [Actinomycetota bacterium]
MTQAGCIRRFEGIARQSPDRIAVVEHDAVVSYARLAGLAGGHAARLLDAGVRPGDRVGLVAGHGTRAIAAILGTLAAGCVYVPLDPTFPRDRLAHQVDAARVSAVLADAEHVELAEALCRNGSARVVPAGSETAPLPVPDPDPDSPAYVLFTSGSTGTPKAFAQTHRNLLHVVDNQIASLGVTAADRLSLLASFGFDAAIPDLYPALLTGAAVVPVDLRVHGVAHAARELARHEVTVYHSTPTVYRHLLDSFEGELPSVRTVLLGGEPSTYTDVRRGRFAPGCVFVNGYGATEVTFAAHHRLTREDVGPDATGPLPIGTALPGYELTVLDGGELEVRSAFLAEGYLDRPSPAFGTTTDGLRTYRTGDLGEVLPDGNLVCLGRLDRQVKVRGFRVELTEIEAKLAESPPVAEARAVVRDGELLAYVVPALGAEPDPAALRSALAEALPAYAVPSAVIVVAAFPLTVTGKLDEEALPGPRPSAPAEIPPMTEAEERVHAIWRDVLGHAGFGVTDAFFDVGGHSLLLGRVQQRLAVAFDTDIPLLGLLEHPTVAAQATYLGESTSDSPQAAGPPS